MHELVKLKQEKLAEKAKRLEEECKRLRGELAALRDWLDELERDHAILTLRVYNLKSEVEGDE